MLLNKISQLKQVVEEAKNNIEYLDSSKIAFLRKCKVGSPAAVYNLTGELAFWIVPLRIKNYAYGFSIVELSMRVSKLGIFGSSPDNENDRVHLSFFKLPPTEFIRQIQTHYPKFIFSNPILSFDDVPSKWGWLIRIENKKGIIKMIYITPAGWYESAIIKTDSNSEG